MWRLDMTKKRISIHRKSLNNKNNKPNIVSHKSFSIPIAFSLDHSICFFNFSAQQPRQGQNVNVPSKTSPSSHAKTQTVVNVQPQKPPISIATVQPQTITTQSSISQSISNVTSAILQRTPSITSRSPSLTGNQKLPQVPPRMQSQGSVTRGPPPAIPPRNNVATPTRSSSIQVTSSSALTRPTLAKQASANSITPQYTPQPAPKFVIPQRQNSRASLNRSGSISGASSNGD